MSIKTEIKPDRRVGNTTRQIDAEIQELFEKKEVFIWDHADRRDVNGTPINMAHEDHIRRLFRRLRDEHNLSLKNHLIYDPKQRVLSLKLPD